jgi:hypothetical protein
MKPTGYHFRAHRELVRGPVTCYPVADCVLRLSFSPHASHTNVASFSGSICTCPHLMHLIICGLLWRICRTGPRRVVDGVGAVSALAVRGFVANL